MIVIRDCMPAMADVVSGAIPEPEPLRAGSSVAAVAAWARNTPAIRALCATWNVMPDALVVGGGDSAPVGASWELLDTLGDGAAVVHLAGRLVALNSDGTRCAFYDADNEDITLDRILSVLADLDAASGPAAPE